MRTLKQYSKDAAAACAVVCKWEWRYRKMHRKGPPKKIIQTIATEAGIVHNVPPKNLYKILHIN